MTGSSSAAIEDHKSKNSERRMKGTKEGLTPECRTRARIPRRSCNFAMGGAYGLRPFWDTGFEFGV